MTPAKKLRVDIEKCELPHMLYQEQINALGLRIDDALNGAASRIERLIGPSRVGKSILIEALKRKYPETKVNGRRQIPLLVVEVPTPVSPRLLPLSVLDALGCRVRGNKNGSALLALMFTQLELAGTRAVIFDEANHLVEVGTRVPRRSAGDWFKMFADALDLTVVLSGVPSLERLFADNEQLRMRASAARWLMPYDSRVPEQLKAFHGCVATFANLFKEAGYRIDIPSSFLTYQCYLIAGGLMGILSRFMQELASQMAKEAPRPVTFLDCQRAFRNIEAAGSPLVPVFDKPEDMLNPISPAALHTAFVKVMNDNSVPIPVLPQVSGGTE